MFNQISVQYSLMAKTKKGEIIKRVGKCELSIIEETLHDVLTNVYFFVLAEFVKQEFGGEASQLSSLEIFSFLLDDICID